MTQEEKYKEALLEARAVLEPCLKYSKGKVREALDSIDNELKRFESEDERIRMELKEAFEAYDIESKWNGIPVRSIFAWLEKQKEPENTSASTMVPSCWAEEHPKEQKPKAKAKSPLSPHELYDAKIEGISQGRQDVLDHPEQFGLQKPAEWSEEDKNTLDDACRWIAEYAGYLMDKNYGKASMLMGLTDKLKSLRPSWKPSEEQMEALKRTIHLSNFGAEENRRKSLSSLYEQLKKL